MHIQNFIDCVRSRKVPAADMQQGHLSASLVHLGNIAYRAGKTQLLFDGKNESFTANDEANKLLMTNYREGYVIPEKI